jgi:hypothetical protein
MTACRRLEAGNQEADRATILGEQALAVRGAPLCGDDPSIFI